jgi:hypothetical protein
MPPEKPPTARLATERGEVLVDAEVLRQIAETAAERVGLGDDVGVAEEDAPRGRLRDRRDHLHQRRLARAVGAEEPEDAAVDREGDVADSVVAGTKTLGDRLDA